MRRVDYIEQLDKLLKDDVFHGNLLLLPLTEFGEEHGVEDGRIEGELLERAVDGQEKLLTVLLI